MVSGNPGGLTNPPAHKFQRGSLANNTNFRLICFRSLFFPGTAKGVFQTPVPPKVFQKGEAWPNPHPFFWLMGFPKANPGGLNRGNLEKSPNRFPGNYKAP